MKKAFTLTEVLITTTLLIAVSGLAVMAWQSMVARAKEEQIQRGTRAVSVAKGLALSLGHTDLVDLLEEERWEILRRYMTWPAEIISAQAVFGGTDIERVYIRDFASPALFIRRGEPISPAEADALAEQERIRAERNL